MTYQRHEAAVITTSSTQAVDSLIAFRETMPEGIQPLFIGPIQGVGPYWSFAFMPDGSGEGYPWSNLCEEWRDNLKAFLRTVNCDWVHVQITEDSGYIRDERGALQPFKPFVVAYGQHSRGEYTELEEEQGS